MNSKERMLEENKELIKELGKYKNHGQKIYDELMGIYRNTDITSPQFMTLLVTIFSPIISLMCVDDNEDEAVEFRRITSFLTIMDKSINEGIEIIKKHIIIEEKNNEK